MANSTPSNPGFKAGGAAGNTDLLLDIFGGEVQASYERMSLETAARQAWEAGYFDHVPAPTMDSSDNMHPVTPEMLIAALDRELREDYAHVWGEHDAEFFA